MARCGAVIDSLLLDEVMPDYHFRERHAVSVRGTREAAWQAVRQVTGQEVRLLGALLSLRQVPDRLGGSRGFAYDRTRPILEGMTRLGFVELGERPGEELVLGTIGRFWRLTGNLPVRVDSAQAILAFDEAGYAKTVVNFLVREIAPGTVRVSTETRTRAMDPASRRKFAAYWAVIRPGSGFIRNEWLKAIRRRVEGAPR